MQIVHVVVQLIAIGIAHRSQFLHANLNHAREVLDPLLRGRDDLRLRAEAHPHLGAQRQREQTDHQHDQLRLQVQRGEV